MKAWSHPYKTKRLRMIAVLLRYHMARIDPERMKASKIFEIAKVIQHLNSKLPKPTTQPVNQLSIV